MALIVRRRPPACLCGPWPAARSVIVVCGHSVVSGCQMHIIMDAADAHTLPILDAITDTLRGRAMSSRRVASPVIVTSSLAGDRRRCVVSARDIRCGRGLGGDVIQPARGSVTSRRDNNGCVVNGNGKQQPQQHQRRHCGEPDESSADEKDDEFDVDLMSVPWDMMSRWCRYAALSSLLSLW